MQFTRNVNDELLTIAIRVTPGLFLIPLVSLSRSTSGVLEVFASDLGIAVEGFNTIKETIHGLCSFCDMGDCDIGTDIGPGAHSGPSVSSYGNMLSPHGSEYPRSAMNRASPWYPDPELRDNIIGLNAEGTHKSANQQ